MLGRPCISRRRPGRSTHRRLPRNEAQAADGLHLAGAGRQPPPALRRQAAPPREEVDGAHRRRWSRARQQDTARVVVHVPASGPRHIAIVCRSRRVPTKHAPLEQRAVDAQKVEGSEPLSSRPMPSRWRRSRSWAAAPRSCSRSPSSSRARCPAAAALGTGERGAPSAAACSCARTAQPAVEGRGVDGLADAFTVAPEARQ